MELKWIHCNILDTQVKWRWEARPIRYGELRSVQKAKIAQGTSWPKHAMIRKVKIQRPPNNQHQISGNGKSAGRRKTYFPSWRQKEINFVWAEANERQVDRARPWVKKEWHCWSKAKRSRPPEDRGDPSRMRLRIRTQLFEVLPTKTRQSNNYLIVNTGHMLSRKGETMTGGRKKQAAQ